MKTLDQMEARTPLGPSTTTVGINANGSYYLTGDIVVASGSGILIAANNAEVDLNGFTISSTNANGSGAGVSFSGTGSLVVRHGRIAGSTTLNTDTRAFTAGGFANGVYVASGAASARIEDLDVSAIAGTGLNIGSLSAVISRCQTSVTSGGGVDAGNASVDHCVVIRCGGVGINATLVDHCSAVSYTGNAIQAAQSIDNSQGTSIASNAAAGSGLSAAAVLNSNGSTTSGGDGVKATTATNCSGSNTGTGSGVNATTARGCNGTAGSGNGISATTVSDCYGNSTNGRGISAVNVVNSTGNSSNAVGIFCTTATNCQGTGGTQSASFGIDCGVNGIATGCYANAASASGYSLRAKLANGCVLGTGQVIIVNKVNTF